MKNKTEMKGLHVGLTNTVIIIQTSFKCDRLFYQYSIKYKRLYKGIHLHRLQT